MDSEPIIRAGVVGLGRAGWNMHVRTMRDMPDRFRVVAATDPVAERRAQAEREVGCRAYDDFDAVLHDPDVELVVIASPSGLHHQQVTAALKAGKHVLCDKPLAMHAAEVDDMTAVAEAAGRGLYVFQVRRYEPVFLKIKELIEQDTFGEVGLIRMCWHRFGRRWDWQADRSLGGGMLGNACAHALDQLLQLAGPGEPTLMAVDLRNALCSGDAEDCVKIVFRCGDGPTIDLQVLAMDAFGSDRWLVYGTDGTLRASMHEAQWRVADWDKMPPRPLEPAAAAGRQYPSEDVVYREYQWEDTHEGQLTPAYYRDLYDTIVHGKPPVVTVESVRRQIALVERCRNEAKVHRMRSICDQWRAPRRGEGGAL